MKIIYSSGIAVAVTPFLGVPYSWKNVLLVILGALIFIKGYSYYKKSKKEVKQLEASFEQNEKPEKPIIREVSSTPIGEDIEEREELSEIKNLE